MAVIWCNELHPRELPGAFAADPPPGTVEITRVEEIGDCCHIWYAPVPAAPSGEDRIRDAMAEAVRHHVRTSAR